MVEEVTIVGAVMPEAVMVVKVVKVAKDQVKKED
jgi:hypothetical protein